VLISLGADLARVRQQVTMLLPPASESLPSRVAGMTPVGLCPHTAFAAPATGERAGSRGACSFCGRDLREVGRYIEEGATAIRGDCVTTAATAPGEGATDLVEEVPVGQWQEHRRSSR
jgi:hypothetical protein